MQLWGWIDPLMFALNLALLVFSTVIAFTMLWVLLWLWFYKFDGRSLVEAIQKHITRVL